MKRWCLVLCLLFPPAVLGVETGSIELQGGSSGIMVISQNTSRTVIDVNLARLDYQRDADNKLTVSLPDQFSLSRGSYIGPENTPLPTITRTLAIPIDCNNPHVNIISSHLSNIDDIDLAEIDSITLQSIGGDNIISGTTNELVTGRVAGIMRDLKLYSVTISPVQYDAQKKQLRVYDDLQIEISHTGSQICRYPTLSEAFAPVYRGMVDNPEMFDPVEITRGAYWIIFADSFAVGIQPLIDWKMGKGYSVVAISRSTIGLNTDTNIRNYIRNRFDTCLVKPDYIAIVGDVTPYNRSIVTHNFSNSQGAGRSDNYYSFIDGNDYFPEVLIGRISVTSSAELANYLYKLFSYERTPDMNYVNWFTRSTMVGSMDETVFTPRLVNLLIREMLLEKGFSQVDTFFGNDIGSIPVSAVRASINTGAAYVNYRGWGLPSSWLIPEFSVDEIGRLSNGPRFGIMTSMGEATGDFADQTYATCLGEAWIRANNKGGAGFIGDSDHFCHAIYNDALDCGLYWGLFETGVSTLAQAELMGKMAVYNAFPSQQDLDEQVELYFNAYNIIGDPELNCWKGVPRPMSMSFPDSIALGVNRVPVRVVNESGSPVNKAVVCLWNRANILSTKFTNQSGVVDFEITPRAPGPVRLTVTASGFIPREDTINYYSSPLVVSYLSYTISDDSLGESTGNGDGLANPSELIELDLGLKNYGSSEMADNITCTISSSTPGVEITRDSASFGNIPAGDSATGSSPYLIRISPDASHGEDAILLMDIRDGQLRRWQGMAVVPLHSPNIIIDSLLIDDGGGNGRIDRGETASLLITAHNAGSGALLGAAAILRSRDRLVTIIDSISTFGDCAPGESFSNNLDYFTIFVDPATFDGHLLNFELEFDGLGPQVFTTAFSLTVGQLTSRDPIGPDAYGYYCFDNQDIDYAERPIYNWIVIDTNWPYVTLSDDAVETIDLPFPVRYYGQEFNRVTICDNGFVTLGEGWYYSSYTAPIPSPQCPRAMIAPLWADLYIGNHRVYYHHDTTGNYFVIGWRNVTGGNGGPQNFELIIYDEYFRPTRTNDNEIIFQYQTYYSMNASVGICSPNRHDGIGYLYNYIYTPGAYQINGGRAIKFTTGTAGPGCIYTLGDINGDRSANGVDIGYGVNYLKGGLAPPVVCDCPGHGETFIAGDVNGSCSFDGIDITYVVNYFKGGNSLLACPDCPPLVSELPNPMPTKGVIPRSRQSFPGNSRD